jgi:putative transcriptional regulator
MVEMTESLAGRLLVASPALVDPNFFRAVVLLLDHDEQGAFGVVLNRASEEAVDHHLPAWSLLVSEPPVVFVGGPVEPVMGIALSGGPERGQPAVVEGVKVVDLTTEPEVVMAPIRIFAGYAGWGASQLEVELAEDAWIVVAAESVDVFTSAPEDLWAAVLRRQGGRLALLSTMPLDPTLN